MGRCVATGAAIAEVSSAENQIPQALNDVVEGYGGEKGNLRLIASYIVLPDGRRINVPADLSSLRSPRALPFRRRSNSKQSQAKGRIASGEKKFAGRRGTG